MFLNLLSWYHCKLLKRQIAYCFQTPPNANHAFRKMKSGWILTMIISYFHAIFMEQCSNCILDCNTVIYNKYIFSICPHFWHACVCLVKSVSDSLPHFELSPTMFLYLWDFSGKNTGVDCHFLLQGIFPTQESNPHFLCLLCCRLILYLLSHLGSPLEKG